MQTCSETKQKIYFLIAGVSEESNIAALTSEIKDEKVFAPMWISKPVKKEPALGELSEHQVLISLFKVIDKAVILR